MAFLENFTFFLSTMILSGPGSLGRLPKELRRMGMNKLCLVTDTGIVEAGLVDQVKQAIAPSELPVAVFDGVVGNPLIETVEAAWDFYQREQCDGLVAVGGGSSIDVAKSVGILAANGPPIDRYEGINQVTKPLPLLIAIPTTYGTGSEVSTTAVVTDPKRRFKWVIMSQLCRPRLAVIEPRLMLRLPAHVGAATGADALTHGIESYTNLMAQPITDALSLHSIRLISGNLRQAVSNEYNLEATFNMCAASMIAGMAFSNANLGVCHSMAHPLGAYFDLHHGLANAVVLPIVMEFCLGACPQRFADIAEAMGEDVRGLPVVAAAERSVVAVRKLLRDVGIPPNLRQLGCSEDQLDRLVDDALAMRLHKVNPRQTSREDFVRLFQRAFKAQE